MSALPVEFFGGVVQLFKCFVPSEHVSLCREACSLGLVVTALLMAVTRGKPESLEAVTGSPHSSEGYGANQHIRRRFSVERHLAASPPMQPGCAGKRYPKYCKNSERHFLIKTQRDVQVCLGLDPDYISGASVSVVK